MTIAASVSWPASQGELATRVRELDWSATPLGRVEGWPQSLKAVVDMLLPSGFPMVALWGPQLVQLYNDGYRQLMGVKHPAVLGQPTRECWPEVWHINAPIYQRVLAGETLKFEDALYPVTRSGSLLDAWFTLAYSPLRDDGGNIAGVLVNVFDTTARHQAEAARAELMVREQAAHAAAEEERQKLFSVFMQAPVAICILEGPRHVFTFANPPYRALVDGRDVVGKPLLEALPDLREGGFDKIMDRVLATGEPFFGKEAVVRLSHQGPDECLIVNFSYQPKRNARGEIDGILAVVTDVTEQVQARHRVEALAEKLRQSEDRLRRVVEASGTGTWEMDVATGELVADARFRALFGLTAEEPFTLAKGLSLIHPEDRARVAQAVGDAVAGKDGGRYWEEYRTFRSPDGRSQWVEARGHGILGPDGKTVRFVGTGVDISVRKHTEAAREDDALRARQDAERDAREARDRADFERQLIGIVSHDLRNPLSVVTTSAALLLRGQELDDRYRRSIGRILSSAERANRMIRDLLDFTQARLGGGLPIQPEPLDLHVLTRQVVDEMAVANPGRTLRLESSGEGQGVWDGDRLAQVLANLLINAVNYSPAGTPVDVRTRGEAGEVLLEVHNAGAPIPPDVLPRVFQPMQRGAAAIGMSSRSVGLGLYIVKHIVDAHGGTIGVRSTESEGTTFTVRLPVRL